MILCSFILVDLACVMLWEVVHILDFTTNFRLYAYNNYRHSLRRNVWLWSGYTVAKPAQEQGAECPPPHTHTNLGQNKRESGKIGEKIGKYWEENEKARKKANIKKLLTTLLHNYWFTYLLKTELCIERRGNTLNQVAKIKYTIAISAI